MPPHRSDYCKRERAPRSRRLSISRTKTLINLRPQRPLSICAWPIAPAHHLYKVAQTRVLIASEALLHNRTYKHCRPPAEAISDPSDQAETSDRLAARVGLYRLNTAY